MKNYLISNIQQLTDLEGNILGRRICDVCDNTFSVSNDYEWKEYSEFIDIYTGVWYWTDKPTEYIPPIIVPVKENEIETEGTQEL